MWNYFLWIHFDAVAIIGSREIPVSNVEFKGLSVADIPVKEFRMKKSVSQLSLCTGFIGLKCFVPSVMNP